MRSHVELVELFGRLKIDTSRPGFYDDPNFIAAETGDRDLLEKYAEFVVTRPYDQEYLVRARRVTTALAEFLYGQLLADGRLGACIDCSGSMLRMLEKEGIWCYMATGGVRLAFAAETNLPTLRFHQFMHADDPAFAAHGWLGVPPFQIVDLTISRQPVDVRVSDVLPRFVLADIVQPGSFDPMELIHPDCLKQAIAVAGRAPTLEDLNAASPGFMSTAAKFGVVDVEFEKAKLTYIPCQVTVPDQPLEGLGTLCLSGRLPEQLYAEYSNDKSVSSGGG